MSQLTWKTWNPVVPMCFIQNTWWCRAEQQLRLSDLVKAKFYSVLGFLLCFVLFCSFFFDEFSHGNRPRAKWTYDWGMGCRGVRAAERRAAQSEPAEPGQEPAPVRTEMNVKQNGKAMLRLGTRVEAWNHLHGCRPTKRTAAARFRLSADFISIDLQAAKKASDSRKKNIRFPHVFKTSPNTQHHFLLLIPSRFVFLLRGFRSSATLFYDLNNSVGWICFYFSAFLYLSHWIYFCDGDTVLTIFLQLLDFNSWKCRLQPRRALSFDQENSEW